MWSLDFLLFKKSVNELIDRSDYSIEWSRSVTLEADLEAGDYVLHVS